MTKKGDGTRDKDADFAVLDKKLRRSGVSLDDLLPHIDWSANNEIFARLDDWSAVDKMFAHLGDLSALDAILPADLMLDKLDDLFRPIEEAMGKKQPRRVGKRQPRRTGRKPR